MRDRRSQPVAKRRPTHQPTSRRWERRAAIALVAVTGLALAWVVNAEPTLGVPGQHAYGYHPAPQHTGLLLLVIASGPLLCVLAILLLRPAAPSSRLEAALVALLAVGSLALHGNAAIASRPYPGLELAWPFLWSNTEGAYAQIAGRAGPLDRFVSNYVHTLDVTSVKGTPHYVHIHHGQVHPPGLILAFACADRFYGAFPAAERAVSGAMAACFPWAAGLLAKTDTSLKHPVAVSVTAAVVAIVLASMAPLACYWALRSIWPRQVVLLAAGLVALVPGTHLFSPSIDQAYPTVVLLLVGIGVRAAATQRWPWGAAFGLALYGAMFIHVGLALAAGILGLSALLAWRARRPEWGARQLVAAYWRVGFAATLGFLTPALILQLSLGYPTFRVILACLRNNRLFNAAVGRTYWPWVAITPFEFCISLGVALGLVCVAGWLAESRAALREGSLRGRNALVLTSVGILALLGILGLNRGETPRLWLFLTPLLVVGAVGYLCRDDRPRRSILAALVFCQWLQLLILRVALDPNWTSTFCIKHLAKQ